MTKIPIVETNSVLLKQISHDIKEVGNLFYVALYADSKQWSNCGYECVGALYQPLNRNIIEVIVSDSLLKLVCIVNLKGLCVDNMPFSAITSSMVVTVQHRY